MRILHVEDNSTDADLVARALRRSDPDVEIIWATGFKDAQQKLADNIDFDAALVDLNLPDGHGLDLLAQIREQRLPLPIVVLTGSGDQQAAITALQCGADDYLQKRADNYVSLSGILASAKRRFADNIDALPISLRVLYAERHPSDVELTRRYLRKHAPHIHLTVVENAEEALALLPGSPDEECDFEVVLLDYRLPGFNALEAVREIRNTRGLEIPIVIVSGQGSELVAAQSIRLGVNDYISKHSEYLHELAPTLEKVHKQYALVRERRVVERTSEHLGFLLEASPVVLYTLEVNQGNARPVWVSANIQRLFGYSVEEALAPGWWEQCLVPDDRQETIKAVARLADADQVVQEYRILDKQGDTRWIRDDIRVTSRKTSGKWAIIGAWTDITAQRNAEQVKQTRLAVLEKLNTGAALDDVLHDIAQRMEEALPSARVSILLLDQDREALHTAAAPSLPDSYNNAVDGLRPQVGLGSCGTSAALGEPVVVEDITTHPYWKNFVEAATQSGLRACWSVPFKNTAGEALGTFGVYHEEPRTPTKEEQELVEEFARITGLAVQRAESAEHLRQAAAVFENTQEGILVCDAAGNIVAVNQAFTQITGYAEHEALGMTPALLKSGRQDETFYQSMWSSLKTAGFWRGEVCNRRKSGEIYPQLLTISSVCDENGKLERYVAVMTDISALKQSQEKLNHLAHHDALTDLPNRLLLLERMTQAIRHAQRNESSFALIFLDIDQFKLINDGLGHPVGDAVLKEVSAYIRYSVREEDTVARIGGDEFVVLLENIHSPENVAIIAEKLLFALREPIGLGVSEVHVSASLGISIYPQDGADPDELLKNADAAMFKAKQEGRNTYQFYTEELTANALERVLLENELRQALDRNQLLLHYQPQIDLQSGNIIGCEAVLRWQHPQHGLISPLKFIPIAEECGLILSIGDWVMKTACHQAMSWLNKGHKLESIAVNIAGAQIQRGGLPERAKAILAQSGLPPSMLELEVTESFIMQHPDAAIDQLQALRNLGVNLSIDDFGTGYSSLSYLKQMPLHKLKIDQSFVRGIPDDSQDNAIAEAVVALALGLGLSVIAEGVETMEQAEFLRSAGCGEAQGFLFSRPVSAEEFETLLKSGIKIPGRTAPHGKL